MYSTLLLLIILLLNLFYNSYQENFGLFRKDKRRYYLQSTSSLPLTYVGCIALTLEEHFDRFLNCPFYLRTYTLPPPGINFTAISELLRKEIDFVLLHSKAEKIGTVGVLITTLDDLTQTIHFLFPDFMKLNYVDETKAQEDAKKSLIQRATESATSATDRANSVVDRINSFITQLNEDQRKTQQQRAREAIVEAINERKLPSTEIPEGVTIRIEPVKSLENKSRYHRWYHNLFFTGLNITGDMCFQPKIFQCPGIPARSYRTGNWLFGRTYYYFHTPCGTNSIRTSEKNPLVPTIVKDVFYTFYRANTSIFTYNGITHLPNMSLLAQYDALLYDCETMLISENRIFVCFLERGYGLCIYRIVSGDPSISCRSDPSLSRINKQLIFRIPLTSRNYATLKIEENNILLIDSYEGKNSWGQKAWLGKTVRKITVNSKLPILLRLSNVGVLEIIDTNGTLVGELSGEVMNAGLEAGSPYGCSTYGFDGRETTGQSGAGSSAALRSEMAKLIGDDGKGGRGDGTGGRGDEGIIPQSDLDRKTAAEKRALARKRAEDEYIRKTCPVGIL